MSAETIDSHEKSAGEILLERLGLGQFAHHTFTYHDREMSVAEYVSHGNPQAVAAFEGFLGMDESDPGYGAMRDGIHAATVQMLGLEQDEHGEWVHGSDGQ